MKESEITKSYTHFLRVFLSYLFSTNEVATGGTVWLKSWQIMGDVWTL
jgi:hypothetical protein